MQVPIPYTVLIFMFGVMSGVITTIFSQICVDGQPKEKRNCEVCWVLHVLMCSFGMQFSFARETDPF